MPGKAPLYYRKSKAAKELEYDYDLYRYSISEENFQRNFAKDPERIRYQTTYKQYDPSYYSKRNERIAKNDLLYDSDTHDVEDEYFDNIIDVVSYSDDAESVVERTHKYKRDKKEIIPENGYNHTREHKGRNNHIKNRNSSLNDNEISFMSDKRDYNVYISQRPIHLQHDIGEPLESTAKKKTKSKHHKRSDSKPLRDYEIHMANLEKPKNKVFSQKQEKGIFQMQSKATEPYNKAFQTNLVEQTKNINFPDDIDQASLRLYYLPVYAVGSDKVLQATGVKQPALIVNSDDLLTGSQNLMSVFAAQNINRNSVFKQKTKTEKRERDDSMSNEVTKDIGDNDISRDTRQIKELEKKLRVSSLGSAMTAEDYASLIASYLEQKPLQGNLPQLVQICKTLKNKKAGPINTLDQDPENEPQELNSVPKTVNRHERESHTNSNAKGDHIAKKRNQKQKSENKNSHIKSKSVEGPIDDKSKPLKEDEKSQEIKSEDLNQTDGGQSIIININKKSIMGHNIPTELSHSPSNKSETTCKHYGTVHQGPVIKGTYKKVGRSQASNTIKSNFDSAGMYNPKAEEDGKKGKMQKYDSEIIFVSQDLGLKAVTSDTSIQSGGGNEILNKPKSILRKESSSHRYDKSGDEDDITKTKQDSAKSDDRQMNTQSDTNIIESSVPKPVETIHPPELKSSTAQRNSDIQLLQSEEQGGSLNDYSSKFEQAKLVLIISYQSVLYILGASCYDNFFNVINFFYDKDD